MIEYGFIKTVDLIFEEAMERVSEELKKLGFGILSKIDVKEKFKEKLGIDYKKYIILGACNPLFAHRALETEENIGLMLPCNVIVYEKEGKVVIGVIKPTAAMGIIGNDKLQDIAVDVENKLKRVLDAF